MRRFKPWYHKAQACDNFLTRLGDHEQLLSGEAWQDRVVVQKIGVLVCDCRGQWQRHLEKKRRKQVGYIFPKGAEKRQKVNGVMDKVLGCHTAGPDIDFRDIQMFLSHLGHKVVGSFTREPSVLKLFGDTLWKRCKYVVLASLSWRPTEYMGKKCTA